MSATRDGQRIGRKLNALTERARKRVADANRKSGEELLSIARVLIPSGGDVHGDGPERGKITGTANADGSFLCDFGPKSKVIEGERGPRPFVNPALEVTRKRHRNRARNAMRRAVKESFGG